MNVKLALGSTIIEAEGDKLRDILPELGEASEFFANSQCGACDSEAVYPVVRVAQGYTFFELKCRDCGAALSFGQRRDDQKLFAKRTHRETGAELPNKGWTVWKEHQDG